MTKRITQKFLHRLQNEVLKRRLPHGLLGPLYLWPGCNHKIRAHRTLWWKAGEHWPRSIWLALQLVVYFRWIFLVGPLACITTWKRWRAEDRENYPIFTLLILMRLALFWCIPPHQVRQFGLLKHPRSFLNYVYSHEISAYHALRSDRLGQASSKSKILQDKLYLTKELSKKAIPMAPIIRHVECALPPPSFIKLDLELTDVFCKTRSGKRGLGAFAAWKTQDGWIGKTFKGTPLNTTTEVEAAWKSLCRRDDVIIQKNFKNHPTLSSLSDLDEAITIRFITYWNNQQIACLLSSLEIPIKSEEDANRINYGILPIDPQSSRIQPWPVPETLSSRRQVLIEKIYDRAAHILKIPHWHQIIESSYRAHTMFPGIWAIAWDWVITSDGPMLLEGNTGWAGTLAQQLKGGWLATKNFEVDGDNHSFSSNRSSPPHKK